MLFWNGNVEAKVNDEYHPYYIIVFFLIVAEVLFWLLVNCLTINEKNVLIDSIAETMNVPPDHTFGLVIPPDEYGKFKGRIQSYLADETLLK